MSKISIDILRGTAKINGKSFPMYSGFASARTLLRIAKVPSFDRKKEHHAIAMALLHPPVDEWQRPLDKEKVEQIQNVYSDRSRENLMANPVLLGAPFQDKVGNAVRIEQKTIQHNGETVPVPELYSLTVHYDEAIQPLWVLDGQHRINGLAASQQADEQVPFVLLYDSVDGYAPNFLAKIFTQVTTNATPLQPVHGEWMQYSFELNEYTQRSNHDALEAIIHLCNVPAFDGTPNPFQNAIGFNPYVAASGYGAFNFSLQEWKSIVASSFFTGGTDKISPVMLAGEIAKAVRALRSTDRHAERGNSRLFGSASNSSNNHRILAEAFLRGILVNLREHPTTRTEPAWEDFLRERGLHHCDWSLPFVQTTGAMSSTNGGISKKIADECFDLAINDRERLGGTILTDYLQGIGALIKLVAYMPTSNRRPAREHNYELDIPPGGLRPFPINANHPPRRREIIRVVSGSPNLKILRVTDPTINPHRLLRDATTLNGFDLVDWLGGTSRVVNVNSMSYSGDTEKLTEVRLDFNA